MVFPGAKEKQFWERSKRVDGCIAHGCSGRHGARHQHQQPVCLPHPERCQPGVFTACTNCKTGIRGGYNSRDSHITMQRVHQKVLLQCLVIAPSQMGNIHRKEEFRRTSQPPEWKFFSGPNSKGTQLTTP